MSQFQWKWIVPAICLLAGCDTAARENDPAVAMPTARAPVPAEKPALFPSQAVPAAGKHQAKNSLPFVLGFEAGSRQAASTGKPMLVFFTAEWCRYCHQMADEVFINPQVQGLANRFVCILVDADAEPEVCGKFRVQGFPTVQFLTSRGIPLNRLVGKKPGGQVVLAMQAALQNVAQRSGGNGGAVTR